MNQLSYFAPQLAGPASVLGQLKLQVAIVVFLISNGHLLYIRALDSSFRELGVLQFPRIAPGSTALLETAARLSANALLIGLQMAAPVLVALLLVDVAFGLIGRMAQQIQVHQESQPVKAMAGLGILLLASGFWMTRLEAHLGAMLGSVNQMVQVLRP
jgi:flagellar biosynthetic protein FliR